MQIRSRLAGFALSLAHWLGASEKAGPGMVAPPLWLDRGWTEARSKGSFLGVLWQQQAQLGRPVDPREAELEATICPLKPLDPG